MITNPWRHTRALPIVAAAIVACGGDDTSAGGAGGSTSDPGQRAPIGKADLVGSCAAASGDHCGAQSEGNCWCDDECDAIGDCCADRGTVCGAECTARFAWLQKDAYLDKAGRSSDFWPPHTTTVLTITCGGEVVSQSVMKNHGTGPEAVDDSGTPILVEVRAEQATGSQAKLLELGKALEACECGTEFLSLDALGAPSVEQLVSELAAYIDANLTCPGDGAKEALIEALTSGDLELFLANAPACTWASGESWEEGLDTAVRELAEQVSKTLDDYHVCNNDAMLQAGLWKSFVETGQVGACDAGSPVCNGPEWFYTP